MGYTHYFEFKTVPHEIKVREFLGLVRRIINTSNVPIQRCYDDPRPPCVTPSLILFNGVGDDGHETFELKPTSTKWGFCKTAQKPYDEIVVAILLAADMIFGNDFNWSSDGDDEEHEAGRQLLTFAHALQHAQTGETR